MTKGKQYRNQHCFRLVLTDRKIGNRSQMIGAESVQNAVPENQKQTKVFHYDYPHPPGPKRSSGSRSGNTSLLNTLLQGEKYIQVATHIYLI